MTIEQHAEAAAEEIDRSMTDGPVTIIAKHMQSAIDEATARLLARIAELEGLGPLIDLYGSSSWNDGYTAAEGQRRTNTKNETKAKIDAILKGESVFYEPVAYTGPIDGRVRNRTACDAVEGEK